MCKYKYFILLTISVLNIDRYMHQAESKQRKHLRTYIEMRV